MRARQMKRAKRKTKQLKAYLGPVYRDILRQLENREGLKKYFLESLKRVDQLLHQEKQTKNKLYSFHAPEVECIGKGKSNKKMSLVLKQVW